MTAAQPISKTYTFDEYVALEQTEGIRYEYWDGEVIAMAGTTKRHNRIVQSLSRLLYPFAQRSGCDVYAENVRQKLKTGQRYVYPDIIYTCDPADLENDMGVWVSSPSLLIEVVSSSTHSRDFHENGLITQNYPHCFIIYWSPKLTIGLKYLSAMLAFGNIRSLKELTPLSTYH